MYLATLTPSQCNPVTNPISPSITSATMIYLRALRITNFFSYVLKTRMQYLFQGIRPWIFQARIFGGASGAKKIFHFVCFLILIVSMCFSHRVNFSSNFFMYFIIYDFIVHNDTSHYNIINFLCCHNLLEFLYDPILLAKTFEDFSIHIWKT